MKSYNQPRRDQRQQVIAAARELEMMVVPEGWFDLYAQHVDDRRWAHGIEQNTERANRLR